MAYVKPPQCRRRTADYIQSNVESLINLISQNNQEGTRFANNIDNLFKMEV